jgi:hypothetical protein
MRLSLGYVIEVKHRAGGSKYIGTVPTESGEPNVEDFENTMFDSLEEASKFPFPTAEVAAYVVQTFPPTKNLDYEVVEVEEEVEDGEEIDDQQEVEDEEEEPRPN